MLTRSPTRRTVVFATIFALAALGIGLFMWNKLGGGIPLAAQGYRASLNLQQAQNLLPNEDVRISGVTVGKVVSVTPGETSSHVVVQIDERFAPLHRDDRAIVRVKTLLGESFIALTPGTPGSPTIPDGGQLPNQNVLVPQTLNEVLSAFNARTRTNFRKFLQGSAAALQGRGFDLNTELGQLAPTADELDQLVTLFNAQGGDLRNLISGLGATFDAISAQPAELRQFVSAGRQLFATTARYRHALSATITALPPFQQALRSAAAQVAGTAHDLSPTVLTLLPVRASIGPAISSATALTSEARQLVIRLLRQYDLARTGLPALSRILPSLPPLFAQIHNAGRQLVPVLRYIGAYKEDLVAFLADYSSVTNASFNDGGTGTQHYARGLEATNNESYTDYVARPGTDRHNAYPPPLWQNELGPNTPLKAADCQNAQNATPSPPASVDSIVAAITGGIPAIGGAPPCVVQPPWTFGGVTKSYHKLKPYP
jgi:virulence factor Mce-like protein